VCKTLRLRDEAGATGVDMADAGSWYLIKIFHPFVCTVPSHE
jgi:hypothetical protein